jgi:hypothetical protein
MHHPSSTGILRNDFESLREELSQKLQELISSTFDI